MTSGSFYLRMDDEEKEGVNDFSKATEQNTMWTELGFRTQTTLVIWVIAFLHLSLHSLASTGL